MLLQLSGNLDQIPSVFFILVFSFKAFHNSQKFRKKKTSRMLWMLCALCLSNSCSEKMVENHSSFQAADVCSEIRKDCTKADFIYFMHVFQDVF